MRVSDQWAAWSRRAFPEYWKAVDRARERACARIMRAVRRGKQNDKLIDGGPRTPAST